MTPPTMPRKECKLCHRHAMRRINRKGWLQQRVLPAFGYFPWECVFCRTRQFFRDAGNSRHAHDGAADPEPLAPGQ